MVEGKSKTFTAEQRLLILTGRLTFSQNDIDNIISILDHEKINWFEFLKLTGYHKTIALSIYNIKRIVPSAHFPKYFKDLVNYLRYCTNIRNSKYQEQVRKIQDKCKERTITIIPVKGSYLIPNLYKDYSIRYSGDMDFLVRHRDIKAVEEVIKELGFIQGTFDSETNKISEISRAVKIKWNTFMSNLYPFLKLSDCDIFPYYKLDFRYALDDSLNKDTVNDIVGDTATRGYTLPSNYLIHLCTHFYNEAKYTASIAAFKDLNIIKLCDIREFIIKYVNEDDWELVTKFSIKYQLEKAIYYTMYCLKEIYNDGYEENIMSRMNIKDMNFISSYGENALNENYSFKKTFWERFFSCGNDDELSNVPKHLIDLE